MKTIYIILLAGLLSMSSFAVGHSRVDDYLLEGSTKAALELIEARKKFQQQHDCLENNIVRACLDLGDSDCYKRENDLNPYYGCIYYEKACDLDHSVGCLRSDYFYYKGIVKQDYNKAKTYFEKACNLNDGVGCFNLGFLHASGQGVGQDYSNAKLYYEKACNLNNDGGCLNLGALYYNGQGVRQDYSNAKLYYEKACNLNAGAGCNNLGVLYYNGQGLVQNKTTAKEYYRKACDLGDKKGCDNYRKLNEQGY